MRLYGFRCKTPGCKTFLQAGELAENTGRGIQIPINLGEDPRKFPCRNCGQAHDYYFSEHITIKTGS
jgi:hypothetical protein